MKLKLKAVVVFLGASILGRIHAKDSDNYNIRFNPISFLQGFINADLDFKLTEEWTLGPTLGFVSVKSAGVRTSGYVLGARANWYPQHGVFESGFYVGPSLSYLGVSSTGAGRSHDSASLTMLQAIAGYHWFWPSGFNLNLGGGFTFVNWPDYVDYNTVVPSIEFSLGYAFK